MDKILVKKASLDNAQILEIKNYKWCSNAYEPGVTVQLVHDEYNFYIRFTVYETNPVTERHMHLSDVHRDSCVEWFVNFAPDSSDKYFNFEMNSAGTAYAACRRGRNDDIVFMELTEIAQMNIHSERHDSFWTLEYAISENLIKKYIPSFKMSECSRIKTNFYKCGETEGIEHYGMLFPIDTPTPDFHRPEFFQIIEVE